MLRLCALAGLGQGAAHSLNNAFTVMLGELGFIEDDRKDEPELQDSYARLRSELDRCIRLSRGMLAFREAGMRGEGEPEADLVRAVRDVEPLLRETLGSRIALSLELPDDLLLTPLGRAGLSTAIVALAQVLSGAAPGAAGLRLRADGDSREIRLQLDLTCDDVTPALLDTLRLESDGGVSGLVVRGIRELVAEVGGRLEALELPDARVRVCLILPSSPEEPGLDGPVPGRA